MYGFNKIELASSNITKKDSLKKEGNKERKKIEKNKIKNINIRLIFALIQPKTIAIRFSVGQVKINQTK